MDIHERWTDTWVRKCRAVKWQCVCDPWLDNKDVSNGITLESKWPPSPTGGLFCVPSRGRKITFPAEFGGLRIWLVRLGSRVLRKIGGSFWRCRALPGLFG